MTPNAIQIKLCGTRGVVTIINYHLKYLSIIPCIVKSLIHSQSEDNSEKRTVEKWVLKLHLGPYSP